MSWFCTSTSRQFNDQTGGSFDSDGTDVPEIVVTLIGHWPGVKDILISLRKREGICKRIRLPRKTLCRENKPLLFAVPGSLHPANEIVGIV
jgi:hypothetical protein